MRESTGDHCAGASVTRQAASAVLSVTVAALATAVDIGLARLGYGLLLPAIRAESGGSYALYGLIGAVHLAGYLIGTLLGARLLRDRAHLPRTIVGAQVIVAAGLAASAWTHAIVIFAVARVIVGIASGVGIVAVITDALERVGVKRRGFASGVAWSGIGIGLIVSAPAGQWAIADSVRWRAGTFAFAAAALLVALIALGLRPVTAAAISAARAELPFGWRDLATRRYLTFVGAYTCFGIAYVAYATFAVAGLAARGIRGEALTAVWLGYGVAAVIGALLIGRVLSSRWHRYALAMPLLAGTAGCALSTLPGAFWAIAGAYAVGSSLAATPGVASAFARDRSNAATAAHAFAAVTACFGLGQIAGPLLAGTLADIVSLSAVPVLSGTVFALGTVLALIDASHAKARAV